MLTPRSVGRDFELGIGPAKSQTFEATLLALMATLRGGPVAAISVRNLEDGVKERLRVRAARHGRSMESEVRAILVEAVREPNDADGLLHAMLDRFGEIGGVALELPPRATPARAANLSS